MRNRDPKQFWQLFKLLPQALKDVLSADETTSTIDSVSKRNQLSDEQVSRLASLVGDVLLGILAPEEFEKHLKTELGITADKAKRINQEISRLIFFQVKESLAEIYGKKVPLTHKPKKVIHKEKVSGDMYRESLE